MVGRHSFHSLSGEDATHKTPCPAVLTPWNKILYHIHASIKQKFQVGKAATFSYFTHEWYLGHGCYSIFHHIAPANGFI